MWKDHMSVLLEAYRRIAGDDRVRRQGNGWNGPCPFCGGSERRSDRFVVWDRREENLGETCMQHGIAGVWYCRQCGKSGDTLAFLMEAEGMTFKSACAELGITTTARRPPSRRTPQPRRRPHEEFTPSEWPIKAEDPAKWREYTTKLHAESRENLHKNPHALEWLARRGLDQTAIDRYQLGYLPGEGRHTGRWRARGALGLAPKKDQDGRDKTIIFIPRGIVIPHFDAQGQVIRLRIRRPKPDIANGGKKYLVLEGSSSQPMLLESSQPRLLAAYVTIEAELCGMLIHYATGEKVGTFAALTNKGKPDKQQHPILCDAAAILLAQDYDPREVTKPDGSVVIETPGGEGAAWWMTTYPNAKRWPVPVAKDPGDAFAEGLDIRAWVAAGLPPSIALSAPDTGPMEPFSAGMKNRGGGGTAKVAPEKHAGGEMPLNLPAYMPREHIPAKVLTLHEAWRLVPGFTVIKRENGGGYRWNTAWAAATPESSKVIRDLQERILRDATLWEWVHVVNQNDAVDIDNLFHIYG